VKRIITECTSHLFWDHSSNIYCPLSLISVLLWETYLSCTALSMLRADSLHIYAGINTISRGKRQLLLEIQVWTSMAICAHHATLIYNDTSGNAASLLICNANLPPDQTNMAQQSVSEGANCAEVACSNMRAYNWRTRSVCVKNHLHITSTVSVRWWNIINWNTCGVLG